MPDAPTPEPAAPATPPAPDTPPVPQPPTPATPAPPAAVDPAAPTENLDELPEWARKSLSKANTEAAKYRTAAQEAKEAAEKSQQDLVQNIGKALGLVKDDETPTVETLTTTLQDRDSNLSKTQTELAAQRAENTVLRIASRSDVNADADALLDSRGFTEKLAGLDSAAADYASQVEVLVKAEVESNARYRKVQVAPRSSNGDPAPSGGDPAPKDDIDSLRAEYRKERGVTD